MATRTYSEKVGGKYKATRSHALCDDCDKEHEQSHQGRVTAPLPHGWSASLEDTTSGKSSCVRYNCGCKVFA